MWLSPEERKPTQGPPYRGIAFAHYGRACLACGSVHKLEVHHIDGNRLNREITNLAPLCHAHHKALHRVRGQTKQQRLDSFNSMIAEVKSRNEAGIASDGQSEPKVALKELPGATTTE